MKKCLIILGLFLLILQIKTFANVFVKETYPMYNNYNQVIRRPLYNLHRSSYDYQRYNKNNAKRIARLNKLRQLNRFKNQ